MRAILVLLGIATILTSCNGSKSISEIKEEIANKTIFCIIDSRSLYFVSGCECSGNNIKVVKTDKGLFLETPDGIFPIGQCFIEKKFPQNKILICDEGEKARETGGIMLKPLTSWDTYFLYTISIKKAEALGKDPYFKIYVKPYYIKYKCAEIEKIRE